MAIDIGALFKQGAFKDLEPERQVFFKDLAESIQGKGTAESLGIIMLKMKSMPKGRELTKEEQEAMTVAVMEALPADEQAKLRKIFLVLKQPLFTPEPAAVPDKPSV
jgi:hypothetical protein